MDNALVSLSAASIAFVGSHFAMSHPLRPLLSRFGTGGFMAIYNIVSLATLVWMIIAFRQSPPSDLGGSGQAGWIVATILTLPALVLFMGSLTPRNPAMPTPGAEAAARAGPAGVFRITRHPMMWGFALWAISHLVLWWSTRTVIVATAILILALVGSLLQDAKKQRLMGEAWIAWEAQTSWLPQLSRFLAPGWKVWAAALLVWLVVSWAHGPLGGVPAGIFRWL